MGEIEEADADFQDQVEVNDEAQFLMQGVLNGVLQQLERLERVAEKVVREKEIKRNKVGDRNHVTVEDNFQALKAKLMAFSAMQNAYDGYFRNSSTDRVCEWIAGRPEQEPSGRFAQAIVDTLDACQGRYSPSVRPLKMTKKMLQEYSRRLAEAAHYWHLKEAKFRASPKAAVNKPEMYKISANEESAHDASEVREEWEKYARQPPHMNIQKCPHTERAPAKPEGDQTEEPASESDQTQETLKPVVESEKKEEIKENQTELAPPEDPASAGENPVEPCICQQPSIDNHVNEQTEDDHQLKAEDLTAKETKDPTEEYNEDEKARQKKLKEEENKSCTIPPKRREAEKSNKQQEIKLQLRTIVSKYK